MNEQQFGLCLCCGSPWQPTLESMLQRDKVGSLALFYFERTARTDPALNSLMRRGKQPHFCNTKHNAHMVHKSHHAPALKYAVESACNNKPVSKFPFVTAPTGRHRKNYVAAWGTRRNEHRIDLGQLYRLVMDELRMPMDDAIEQFSWEENMTVQTCVDCNMSMTTAFWYRFHLHTSLSANADRLIPTECIKVFEADTRGNDAVLERWNKGRQLQRLYPGADYDRAHDFLSAYLVYYLQLCLPAENTRPPGMSPRQFQHAKKVYMKAAWIVLQTTCLICEYKLGVEGRGDGWNQNPKSLLGAIELYTSYFAWTLAGYENPVRTQQRLTFAQWHQWYVWDMQGCESFMRHDVQLLAHTVLPRVVEHVPSRALLQQVSERMVDAYRQHLRVVHNIVTGHNMYDMRIREHFVSEQDWDLLQRLGAAGAQTGTFDSALQHIGVRALWTRVIYLCTHSSREFQDKMLDFLYDWQDAEVASLAKKLGENKEKSRRAFNAYKTCLLNPAVPRVLNLYRGCWASVANLYEAGALPSVD